MSLTKWKRIGCITVLLTLCSFTLSAGDVLLKAGLSAADAGRYVLSAVQSGMIPYEAVARVVKSAPPAERIALLKLGVQWVKQYTAGAEFAQAYKKWREENKPTPPTEKGTYSEQMKKQIEEMKRQMETMKESLKSLPADQRKSMEAALEESLKQQMALLNDKEAMGQMGTMYEQEKKARQAEYQEKLKKWQGDFPPEPQQMVARRLQEFLQVSATVDYTAMTTTRNGRLVFVNEGYENKPKAWKLCFRVGRETVDAARTAAAAWVAEINKK